MIRNCGGSLCWDNRSRRYLASKRNYTVWKCYLSNFTKIKLLIINRDNSIGLFNYNFYLRNNHILMFFIKELARLRNFLFVCCLACHTEIVETFAVYPPPTRAPQLPRKRTERLSLEKFVQILHDSQVASTAHEPSQTDEGALTQTVYYEDFFLTLLD